ncbi:MAG: sensor histidine kinase [Verrucomicrobiota bacterium]
MRGGSTIAIVAALQWVGLAGAQQIPISDIDEIRKLSAVEAKAGLLVAVEGVVTFVDPPSTVFFESETGGTFFRLGGNKAPQLGDRIAVIGKTFPGLYLTGIEDAGFVVLSTDQPIPAKPATLPLLKSGRVHYEQVHVTGRVRQVEPVGEAQTRLVLAVDGERIEAVIESSLRQPEHEWIGARVQVRGLAAGSINPARQLVDPYLRVSNWGVVEVLEKPIDQAGLREVSPDDFLQFQLSQDSSERVRLAGIWLGSVDGRVEAMRGVERAVLVEAAKPVAGKAEWKLGDEIVWIGFPEMRNGAAILADAEPISREERGVSPSPVVIDAAALEDGWVGLQSDFVRVSGRVLDRFSSGQGDGIVLETVGGTIPVRLKRPATLPSWVAPGIELDVLGICRVTETSGSGYRVVAESVELLGLDQDSLVFRAAPSWWSRERLALAAAGLGGCVLLGALWIGLLRRQVHRQTRAIRESIQHEAMLEERQRIAREFHDTLEQDLTGLSLQLDTALAVDRERIDEPLSTSRKLVRRIQTETRDLVSELRADRRGVGKIADAIGEVVGRVGDLERVSVELITESEALISERRLHHLRMILTECLTNIRKHADAERVRVELAESGDIVTLRVVDDGVGCDVDADTRGVAGHFGCIGIRERALRIGGEVEWRSEKGAGTEFRLVFPVAEQDPQT